MSSLRPVFLASLTTTIGVFFALLGGLVAVFAVYQLVLAIAAFLYRRPARSMSLGVASWSSYRLMTRPR